MVKAIKENERGRSAEEISRELGINKGTFYNWQKRLRYGSKSTKKVKGTSEREPEAETDVCRSKLRECDVKGCYRKKRERPTAKGPLPKKR